MGTKSPQVSELVYLFESVAFKINASIPAGINPVVNNNFKLIPKSGMWATNWGSKDIPIPKESDNPKINKFLWFISDRAINLMPADVIKPNMIIAAPPITDSGIAAIIPQALEINPKELK